MYVLQPIKDKRRKHTEGASEVDLRYSWVPMETQQHLSSLRPQPLLNCLFSSAISGVFTFGNFWELTHICCRMQSHEEITNVATARDFQTPVWVGGLVKLRLGWLRVSGSAGLGCTEQDLTCPSPALGSPMPGSRDECGAPGPPVSSLCNRHLLLLSPG